MSEQKPTTS